MSPGPSARGEWGWQGGCSMVGKLRSSHPFPSRGPGDWTGLSPSKSHGPYGLAVCAYLKEVGQDVYGRPGVGGPPYGQVRPARGSRRFSAYHFEYATRHHPNRCSSFTQRTSPNAPRPFFFSLSQKVEEKSTKKTPIPCWRSTIIDFKK